ncbi:MAG: hypothetical protein U0V74_01880 [Chitinophagales bacterium]
MKSPSLKFLITVAIVTLICAGGQALWNIFAPAQYVISDGFLLLGIIAFMATAVHLFLLNRAQGSGASFVRSFIGSTALKFMFYLMILIVFVLFTKDNKQVLVIHFLVYYAIYTVLEVAMLYSALQQLKPQPEVKPEAPKA